MIPYIGDISSNDAKVLRLFAEISDNILEFGCGASTQILSKYTKGKIHSIDTSPEWIEKTKKNMEILEIDNSNILFADYHQFMKHPNTVQRKYDFIFDDGVDHLRREFGIKIWNNLEVGGYFAMHDTRRPPDFRNLLEILAYYQDEIETVQFNKDHSNITVVKKKASEPYDNWQISEKKEPWMLGYGAPDLDYILKHYKKDGTDEFMKKMLKDEKV